MDTAPARTTRDRHARSSQAWVTESCNGATGDLFEEERREK
jgi:hypothetical protein